MFQAVQHPELYMLGLVAIRDFLKNREHYLRLVAQSNKADGVKVTITVVASIDPEILENLIDIEEIEAESVDDCTEESVTEFLESRQERNAPVTAELFKAEVLVNISITMSEMDLALRAMKAGADYYSLHKSLGLDFINGKPKKADEHLVSVIKKATLKALIESKLEMDKSELKKDFLEFVGYLKKMAIIHERALLCCGAYEDSRLRHEEQWQKQRRWQPQCGHNSGGFSNKGVSNTASDRDRTKSGHGRSSDSAGKGKVSARELPP
jgi:hypothetical protein